MAIIGRMPRTRPNVRGVKPQERLVRKTESGEAAAAVQHANT
jgi:hypothetical protein